MRKPNLLSVALCFAVLTLISDLRLLAVVQDGNACSAAGGCWVGCDGSLGSSSQTIGASQLTMCSPSTSDTCSGNGNGVCGVTYSYSSSDCDPSTITDSYYCYSSFCN